jgi:hypothetical protein
VPVEVLFEVLLVKPAAIPSAVSARSEAAAARCALHTAAAASITGAYPYGTKVILDLANSTIAGSTSRA